MSTDLDHATIAPEIAAALATVYDPCSLATGRPMSIVEMGLVESAQVSGPTLQVKLRLTSPICMQVGGLIEAIRGAAPLITGVQDADVETDAGNSWDPGMIAQGARDDLRTLRPLPLTVRG